MPVTVLLADDQPIFCVGIRGILSLNTCLKIVAEAHSTEQLLLLAREHLPDLMISDANLPLAELLEVLQTLKQEAPQTKVLLISEEANEDHLHKFLEIGIDGYALKEDPPEHLVQAVQIILQGGMWISPKLIRHMLTAVLPPCQSHRQSISLNTLSRREQEILRLLAMGMENCEIADSLCITKRTVQNHVSTVYQKLCVKGRSQAILFAIKEGVVKH